MTVYDLLMQYHFLREDDDGDNGDLECQTLTLSIKWNERIRIWKN